MARDAAIGAPFGSAGPRKCPDRKQPVDGAPSPEQAAAYVTCFTEGLVSDMLYLVDAVTAVEVGAPRKYNPVVDINMVNINGDKPVYPIRGNYNRFQCSYLAGQGGSARQGANCNSTPQPEAIGLCYINGFANWECAMVDHASHAQGQRGVAPPG